MITYGEYVTLYFGEMTLFKGTVLGIISNDTPLRGLKFITLQNLW